MEISRNPGEFSNKLDDSHSLDDRNIAIDGEIGEGVYSRAWSGPANLEMVHFGVRANARHHARVMTGGKPPPPT